MSEGDLEDVPHIVIVETESELKLIEFERGRMLDAHDAAARIALQSGFFGRVIVAARVRVLGPYDYKTKHACL